MTSARQPQVLLNDETLAMILDELSAAAAAQRPLIQGLSNLDHRSLGRVQQAAVSLQERLNRGQGTVEAISSLSAAYQAPLSIAIKLLVESRSPESVYEVIRLIRQTKQRRHDLIVSSINPLINVSIAATLLFFVMPWVLKALAEMELIRSRLSPTAMEIGDAFTKNFLVGTSIALFVVGAGILVVSKAVSGVGSGKDRFRDLATFCRWVAIQIHPKENPDETANGHAGTTKELAAVIADASEVVGQSFSQSWRAVTDNLGRGIQSATSLAFPEDTPLDVQQCIVDLAIGNRNSEQVGRDLNALSELYEQKSKRRRDAWTIFLPQCLSWIIVLLIVGVLAKTILMPLFEVVIEVVS